MTLTFRLALTRSDQRLWAGTLHTETGVLFDEISCTSLTLEGRSGATSLEIATAGFILKRSDLTSSANPIAAAQGLVKTGYRQLTKFSSLKLQRLPVYAGAKLRHIR